jgi:hypothetical protein
VGTNHVTDIAHKVIRPTQLNFMPGRHILGGEGIVVSHETIHELHWKKIDCMILRLTLRRHVTTKVAFLATRVSKVLHHNGVHGLCNLFKHEIHHYFQTKEGLRQETYCP